MKDVWNALEERTRAWHAIARQGVADAVWEDYVTMRFARTGDPRALEYLYPYLNHASRSTRLRAIEVAARVFEGRGSRAIDALDYFTKNPDPFLRDRAVRVVGSAVAGSPDTVILEILSPYLSHPNRFVRVQALAALGNAAAGQASTKVLTEIRRIAESSVASERDVDLALANVFSGSPTEEVYTLVAKPELVDQTDTGNQNAVAILVRDAAHVWYERACAEIFEPRLHADDSTGWRRDFIRRDGIEALCLAAPSRGMEPLRRVLHLRNDRCTGNAILASAPGCFVAADANDHRAPLAELAREGDVQEQRIAAVCLGRLAMGADDSESIVVLRGLCDARSRAVQSAALTGLGMAAQSTCDEGVRDLCLSRAADEETAAAAIRALGMAFLGSGRADVLADVRARADVYRARPVRGKKYCKPLAACYQATGLLYLGTGSLEPVQFLLDVLAVPRAHRMDEYHWVAARALVMIEFSEATLGSDYVLSG